MKARILLTSIIALIAVAAVAAACGGDDGGGASSEIQTQKGLSVAAISGQSAVGGQTSDAAKAASMGTSGGSIPAVQVASAGRGGAVSSDMYAPAPQMQPGGDGITIQGYGSATVNADSAVMELYFGSGGGVKPMPYPMESGGVDGSSGSGAASPVQVAPGQPVPPLTPVTQEVKPITEADLQPVIDAIVAAGVARSDIQFVSQGYYDPYSSNATLRVTVKNIDNVDGVMQAAKNAASGLNNIFLQNINVSYTVGDCAALEKAAMRAAVEDAASRAGAFAEALGVGLGSVTGAANYSYAPFGGTPCNSQYTGPYPMTGVAYQAGQPSQVQVVSTVSVTYAIK